jgi:RNA polymerase sigma-54 factor
MNPNLKLHTSQQMGMSPQLVASIRLLQLSSAELAQEIAEAIEANPLLEAEAPEAAMPPVADAAETTHQALVGETVSAAVMAGEPAADAVPAVHDEIDLDDHFQAAESWDGRAASGEHNPLDWAAAPERGLRAGIEQALDEALDGFTAPLSAAVLVLLAAIDDAGYLRQPLTALLAEHAESITLPQLQAALRLIRCHAPTGFGAADLRECLLLQLEEVRAGTPGKTLAEQLVSDHLEELHPRQREALRQQLGVSAERMAVACGLIRSLDPRPGQDASEIEARVLEDQSQPGHATQGATQRDLRTYAGLGDDRPQP